LGPGRGVAGAESGGGQLEKRVRFDELFIWCVWVGAVIPGVYEVSEPLCPPDELVGGPDAVAALEHDDAILDPEVAGVGVEHVDGAGVNMVWKARGESTRKS